MYELLQINLRDLGRQIPQIPPLGPQNYLNRLIVADSVSHIYVLTGDTTIRH